jgi:hypothetical protein
MGHLCSRCGNLHVTDIPVSVSVGFQVLPARVGSPALLQLSFLLWRLTIPLGRKRAS